MAVSSPRFLPKEKDRTSPDLEIPDISGYALKTRMWIESGGETFLGFGRVTLLERIKQTGSISQAARSMKMSYRHAWELVESMNKLVKKPLVLKKTGGKGGGGAQLTAEGEAMIVFFREMYQELMAFMKRKQAELDQDR